MTEYIDSQVKMFEQQKKQAASFSYELPITRMKEECL